MSSAILSTPSRQARLVNFSQGLPGGERALQVQKGFQGPPRPPRVGPTPQPQSPRALPSSEKEAHVSLTNLDRDLLRRCLNHKPGAWNDFVDRFLGLVYHVIRHTAHLRSVPIGPEDTEDLAAEVLLQIVANDYAVLRQFRGNSSLATYLTVITRRIAVHELARRSAAREVQPAGDGVGSEAVTSATPARKKAEPDELDSLDEVEKLLSRLSSRDRKVVRLRYLEGRSYEEISAELNIPVNTIGPILARAKKKLRNRAKPGKSDNQQNGSPS